MIKELKRAYRHHILKRKLSAGWQEFNRTGKTPHDTYRALRQMFILTRGGYNDKVAQEIIKSTGKERMENVEGILGYIDEKELKEMAHKMKKDGYYIFNSCLSPAKIRSIVNFAMEEPVHYLDPETGKQSVEKIKYDPKTPISPRYNFPRESILKSEVLQDLIFDDSLMAFAQEYLGCKPILDHLAFWWSQPFKGKAKSEAAQLYHFDMDRIKFMKFFFYLTDVDTYNGPHCYVKNSHTKLPPEISRDGRFTDLDIEKIYGTQNMLELVGKKGTIMAVDTRGMHKGKDLINGERLLFQIEFAISMFGQNYSALPKSLIKVQHREKANQYTYEHIFE